MSFPDYQRKIEIVSDAAVVDKWKEDARKHTTFTTRGDSPETFSSEADAERHFRQNHLPDLIHNVAEVTLSASGIADRDLRRVIEEAWKAQTKSPSAMMQELSTRFRESGLHIFRHRRGMLFVSPIYPRRIAGDVELSPQVRAILEAVAAQPRIGRKELADKLISDCAGDDGEKAKLALASDLKWLIDGGHVIEFNDGSLDLPRAKKAAAAAVAAAEEESHGQAEAESKQHDAAPEMPAAEKEARVEAGAPPVDNETVVATVPAASRDSEIASADSSRPEDTQIGGS
jgi:hypothetical protein